MTARTPTRKSLAVATVAFLTTCAGSGAPPATATEPTTTPPVIVTATTVPATTTIVPPSTTTISLDPLRGLALETVAEELTQPTVVTHSTTDDRRHVVERTGTIDTIGAEGAEETPFLEGAGQAVGGCQDVTRRRVPRRAARGAGGVVRE